MTPQNIDLTSWDILYTSLWFYFLSGRKKFKVCENKETNENCYIGEMDLLRKSTYLYYLLSINSSQKSKFKFKTIIKLYRSIKAK
jgi:hypothetical protein